MWGCSSVGRAPALQAGGQEFDSPHLHQSQFWEASNDFSKVTLVTKVPWKLNIEDIKLIFLEFFRNWVKILRISYNSENQGSSYKEHRVNALASGADEGRDKLR